MTLTEALAKYARDEISAIEVVELIPGPDAPLTVVPRTLDSIETDPDPRGRLEMGTWDEVSKAHVAGRITDEQYEELWNARHA